MNITAIEDAIKSEIKRPQGCYMPNCPASFVKDELTRHGLHQEAKWFWTNIVNRSPFGVESIDSLIPTLNSLDKNERMPEWGMYGT